MALIDMLVPTSERSSWRRHKTENMFSLDGRPMAPGTRIAPEVEILSHAERRAIQYAKAVGHHSARSTRSMARRVRSQDVMKTSPSVHDYRLGSSRR